MSSTAPLHRFAIASPIGSSGTPGEDRKELRIALALVLAYVVANVIYGLIAKAPWDDDCVVRYFNTLKAWHDPAQFFNLWNRPLFVVLFAPAALLGKTAMMLQMVAISAASGWMLFLALRRLGTPRAWMVLPLFFFQNYYFSISRDNLTEPLAVAIFCIGLYALVSRRWLLFAAMGSLLPLARLELSVVLPIWALILFWEKQWKTIAVLALPTLLLMVGGYLVRDHGGLLWLVDETVGASNDKNRYGHKDMWHYFLRFGYVVGPVVFLFFTVGLAERFARWRVDLFILGQSLLIFTLYVLFSWKLNMGNAAGFLRNLIPLTPFIAVFALDGFNTWMLALHRPVAPVREAVPEVITKAVRKLRDARPVPSHSKAMAAHALLLKQRGRIALRAVLFMLLALWITHHYYTWVLLFHQTIGKKQDHTAELITAAITVVMLVLLAFSWKRSVRPWAIGSFCTALIATGIASTLLSETPDAHLNGERSRISDISALFTDGRMQDAPLYVNHPWFFWPKDLGYPADRYRVLTKAAIEAAPPHSRFIWENHYSDRLAGDVPLDYLNKHAGIVQLCTAKSADNALEVSLFQKTDPALHDSIALVDAFLKQYPTLPYGYCSRAMRESNAKQHGPAIADALKMVALDSSYSYGRMVAGLIYFNAQQYAEAIHQFKGAAAQDTVYTSAANQSIGLCMIRTKDMKGALPYLKAALAKDPKAANAQGNLAMCYYELGDYSNALKAYEAFIKLSPKDHNGYVGRGNCYYATNHFPEALADYDRALKVAPNTATVLKNKALALMRLGRKDEACAQFQLAAARGDAPSAGMLTTYCK